MTPEERADELMLWWGLSYARQWEGCPFDEMRSNVVDVIRAAVSEERAACALLVGSAKTTDADVSHETKLVMQKRLIELAAAIRTRVASPTD